MNSVIYTITKISGDYAKMITEDGIENTVAMAFLPIEIAEGCKVLCENFEYSILTQ